MMELNPFESNPFGSHQHALMDSAFRRPLEDLSNTQVPDQPNPLSKVSGLEAELETSSQSATPTPELSATAALMTLHQAFRADDSAVASFVNRVGLPGTADQAQGSGRMQLVSADYMSSKRVDKSLSFSLQTREGDQVRFSMSAYMAASHQASIRSDLGTHAMSATHQAGASLDLTVQGELNDEELAAIDEFVQRLTGAVTAFYQRDLDQSIGLLSQVAFDSTQLTGFSLDMQQSAVATYQSVEQFIEPMPMMLNDNQASAAPLSRHLLALEEYFAQLMQEASELPEYLEQGLLDALLPTLFESEADIQESPQDS